MITKKYSYISLFFMLLLFLTNASQAAVLVTGSNVGSGNDFNFYPGYGSLAGEDNLFELTI